MATLAELEVELGNLEVALQGIQEERAGIATLRQQIADMIQQQTGEVTFVAPIETEVPVLMGIAQKITSGSFLLWAGGGFAALYLLFKGRR